jgi:hypothetical protein
MAGNLDILVWLREHGCPWDGRTLKYAPKQYIYSWALANDCPVDYTSVTDEDDFDESEGDYDSHGDDI